MNTLKHELRQQCTFSLQKFDFFIQAKIQENQNETHENNPTLVCPRIVP